MIKRVFKFGTGDEIPEGSVYLTTLVEEIDGTRFVWHYFLIEMD